MHLHWKWIQELITPWFAVRVHKVLSCVVVLILTSYSLQCLRQFSANSIAQTFCTIPANSVRELMAAVSNPQLVNPPTWVPFYPQAVPPSHPSSQQKAKHTTTDSTPPSSQSTLQLHRSEQEPVSLVAVNAASAVIASCLDSSRHRCNTFNSASSVLDEDSSTGTRRQLREGIESGRHRSMHTARVDIDDMENWSISLSGRSGRRLRQKRSRRGLSLAIYTAPVGVGVPLIALRRAILTWLNLNPTPQIYLLGHHSALYSLAAEFPSHVHVDPTIDSSSLSSAPLFNSLFARALAEPNASLVLLTDPHLMFLSDLLSAASLLTSRFPLWALSGGVRVSPGVPLEVDSLRESLREALRKGGRRSMINQGRVMRYAAKRGVVDVSGGSGGYLMWSQAGLREAAQGRLKRVRKANKKRRKEGYEPMVSLVGESMPPFVSGQWHPWAWLLQELIEQSRDSRRVAREREGEELYVVDGSEAVTAVAVSRELDCKADKREKKEGKGERWMSGCDASEAEAWHEGLNDHLLLKWEGEQGKRKGYGEGERKEEWRGLQSSSVHQGTAMLGMLPLKLSLCHVKGEKKQSFPTATKPCLMARRRPFSCPCESAAFFPSPSSTDPFPFHSALISCGVTSAPPLSPLPALLHNATATTTITTKISTSSNADESPDLQSGDAVVGEGRYAGGKARASRRGMDTSPSFPSSLEALLSRVMAGRESKTVVLTAVSAVHSRLMMSFVCMLRQLHVTNLLIAALDHEIFQEAASHGLPVYLDTDLHPASDPISHSKHKHWACVHHSTHCQKAYLGLRSRAVLRVLRKGYTVIYSDVDVLWMKHPANELLSYPLNTLLILSHETDLSLPANAGPSVNAGFFLAHPHPAVVAALQDVMVRASRQGGEGSPQSCMMSCAGRRRNSGWAVQPADGALQMLSSQNPSQGATIAACSIQSATWMSSFSTEHDSSRALALLL